MNMICTRARNSNRSLVTGKKLHSLACGLTCQITAPLPPLTELQQRRHPLGLRGWEFLTNSDGSPTPRP